MAIDYRIIVIGLAFALAAVDFFSEGHFRRRKGVFKQRLVSFSAGISVAYIFLHLFPQLYQSITYVDYITKELTFIFAMTGFVLYHLIEKYIYKYARRDDMINQVELEHSLTLFFYHGVIGMVFGTLARQNIVNGLLFFIPLSLHVIINALPHSHRFQETMVKAFFTSAPLLGAVAATLMDVPPLLTTLLLGIEERL